MNIYKNKSNIIYKMFFCPNCNYAFDITKSSSTQKGGVVEESSENISDTLDQYGKIIKAILDKEDPGDLTKISIDNLLKNTTYKKLKNKQKEYVYNVVQDLLPKTDKKLLQEKTDKLGDQNKAFFVCNNCGFLKKIEPQTLIFSRTSESISQSYSVQDFSDMLHSNILPITRKYNCPNEKCESHKDTSKLEASFFRLNNTNKIKYICRTCGTDF